jgi:NADPH-dependent 2,4-dienoyl-CoA reductase/sulfur reductase-like enzyme
MKKFDLVVVGGGPSGQIVATTAKRQYPDKSVVLVTEKKDGLVPCGIPYILHDLGSCESNHMGASGIVDIGGELIIDKVKSIDSESKILSTDKGEQISFGKLILATGSTPVVPTFIKGYDMDGVFSVAKDYESMEILKNKVDESKKVVIIGAGFIGCEVAEQVALLGKSATLVEAMPKILSKSFSEKVSKTAEDALQNIGVKLHLGVKVTEIKGENGKVSAVKFEDGTEIPADTVIISIGYKPNVNLAESAGLQLDNSGFIKVDSYMRSNKTDIYAVGDCSSTVGFITGKTDNIMLASTGTTEARILGYNVYNINLIRNFGGTLGIFSTKLAGTTFTCAGANEVSAEQAGVDYVVGEFTGIDRHPGKFKDTSKINMKLLASPVNGVVLGAEIWGSQSAGELINIIGMAIQNEVTVFDLLTHQIGTHPLLTGPPTGYAIIKAAEDIYKKLSARK